MEDSPSFFKKTKRLFSTHKFRFGFLIFLIILFFSLALFYPPVKHYPFNYRNFSLPSPEAQTQQSASEGSTDNSVLGWQNYQQPQIFISGGDQGYTAGGMIALASTDEPAILIGGYNVSGDVEIAMYEASEENLLDYLTHDKEGKQTKSKPDLSKMRFVTNVKKALEPSQTEGAKVPLPLAETGVWYLNVKLAGVSADAYVLRSNIGVISKEGDNELIYWGQNFKTKRSVSDGTVKLFDLQDGKKELQMVSFDAQGIARSNLTADADIALINQNNDRAIVPLNLKYLNYSYNYEQFRAKQRLTRYFIFTDRPLYKPGDTVNFKAVLRDDDDARFTIPGGEAKVEVYNGYYYEGSNLAPIFEKSYPISPDGTINGTYQLPANAEVGTYNLYITLPQQSDVTGPNFYWDEEYTTNSIYFEVQFFRKPEFFVDVSTSSTEVLAGDNTNFTISGSYFSGQPMLGQKVKYKVYAADFYEYQYLSDAQSYSSTISDDYRYGYWYGGATVASGETTLNNNGEAVIDLETKMDFNSGKTQVFSIEASISDDPLDPSFSRRNILVYAGEYGIYRKDTNYGTKINTPLSLPVIVKPYNSNYPVSNISLTAKVKRTNWVAERVEGQKYPNYKEEIEDLPDLNAKTDSSGNATFSFTPTKVGSYEITVSGTDSRGNTISKLFYSYVSSLDQPYYSQGGNDDLTIAADKQKYEPNETIKFDIYSKVPDRDIFLSLERGRVNRFQVVKLNGKTATVEVPIVNTDIPNIFADVSSFSSSALDTAQTKVVISSDSKKVVVNISPDSKTYGPGETVNVDVLTTDVGGNPISAELALWSVDKAIFEISDNNLGDIFNTFWSERRDTAQQAHSLEGILVKQAEGGGCFGLGTKVLMGFGGYKNIEDIKIGDYVLTRSEKDSSLVKAKVLDNHSTEVGGYLILNGNLKVTSNHILWVNGKWLEAGSVQIGDEFTGEDGTQVKVSSIEWQRGKFTVHNLEIEKYHTYFAGGIWVHNEKGIDRNAFKDTAYWNPSLKTDTNGKAKVSFKLPDNLTTWTLAAVAATADTKVGQATNEIIVTKDVIVRPILPNIMRVGDEIVLSAIVQNYTDEDQTFDVDLQFDSGEVADSLQKDVVIKSKNLHQFYWNVKPGKESDKSKLIFSAKVKNNEKLADVLTREVPVREFGFEEKTAQSGEGEKTFDIQLASDVSQEKSNVTLSLSPTMVGALPSAMKYLVNYPYGCVEQTTSRFVPAVIAKTNQAQFAEALKDKNIDEIINQGISRLSSLQQGDGGWSWWGSGRSDSYVTVYVIEYLLEAKKAGVEVNDEILNRAKTFLSQQNYYDTASSQVVPISREEIIIKNYGLTLLGDKQNIKMLTSFENLSPDLLSLIVMANYLNGDINSAANGLDKLISLGQVQGDSIFWEAGNKLNFGSNDASTALAMRAILMAGGDRDTAVKGGRFLMRGRKFDYWSNTFATAQVIRALVDLSKTGDELDPNYSYTVSLDGKQISQGSVSSANQIIKDVVIPAADFKEGGSKISIAKSGNGQIYSTAVITKFHTDKNAKAINNGLSIEREYVNEKGEDYTLGVGDTVLVKIKVGGIKANENYAVITDELPSGMVPINEDFKNEQYGRDPNYYYNSYDVTDREVTENGMILSLYQIAQGYRTYTYRARVINEGTFLVPPATTSLMYAPEINGRSEAQVVTIEKEAKLIPGKGLQKSLSQGSAQKLIAIVLTLVLVIGSLLFFAWKKGLLSKAKDIVLKILRKDNSIPPPPPPPPVPTS